MRNTSGQIGLYLIISFGFSWAVSGLIYLQGGLAELGAAAGPFLMLVMLGPALAAVTCALLFERRQFWRATGLSVPRVKQIFKWLPYAWLVPILLVALSIIVTLIYLGQPPADPAQKMAEIIKAAGGRTDDLPFSLDVLVWLQFAAIPIGILFNTFFLTISEELGWRGWLQPKLAPMGFWTMSGVIGVIWGLWHAPIILMGHNYPGLGWVGVLIMVVFTVALTPYHSLLRERGTGAWGAGAFHGAVNAVAGFALFFIPDATWPYNGLLGVFGFAVMILGWAFIWDYRRRRPVTLEDAYEQ